MSKSSAFLKAEVWERDGGICHLCGQEVPLELASRDHVHPHPRGKFWPETPMKIAHQRCNYARGDLPLEMAYEAVGNLRRTVPSPSQRQVREALRQALRAYNRAAA